MHLAVEPSTSKGGVLMGRARTVSGNYFGVCGFCRLQMTECHARRGQRWRERNEALALALISELHRRCGEYAAAGFHHPDDCTATQNALGSFCNFCWKHIHPKQQGEVATWRNEVKQARDGTPMLGLDGNPVLANEHDYKALIALIRQEFLGARNTASFHHPRSCPETAEALARLLYDTPSPVIQLEHAG